MDFIKKNLVLLICGLAGLASVGLLIFNVMRMGTIEDEMKSVANIESTLSKYTRDAKNPKFVDRENERIDLVRAYHETVMADFTERCRFTPLLPGLLPDPPGGEEGKLLRYQFRPVYQQAMRDLLTVLKAGSPPVKEQIDYVADYLRKKEMQARLTSEAVGGAAPGTPTAPPPLPGTAQSTATAMPPQDGPASVLAYWTALAEKAQTDAEMIASISNARQHFCYADVTPNGTFQLHTLFEAGDSEPRMDQIWKAQLWYWLQQFVVTRIAAVNNAAADAVRAAGDTPWVGNLPVKHVRSIRISDLILGEAPKKRSGLAGATDDQPPDDALATFTRQYVHRMFDVFNLRLRLVIDVRDLPTILDGLTRDSYAVVLNSSYSEIPQRLSFTQYVYGAEPLVEATIDLQMYLSFRAIVPLQPSVIREQLGTENQFQDLVGETADADGSDE